jgi:predicted transposase/invertase (TIGR01784 family)
MRRDSIFYRLFQQRPTLLFDLIPDRPADLAAYQFDAIEVKETSFRIDGAFLPPDNQGLAYFCEVQFQKDELLYERLACEASVYFFRHRDRCRGWRMVAIYPTRSIEQSEIEPFEDDIQTGKLRRIYLDELGDLSVLPIGVSLMVLTTLPEDRAKLQARALLAQSQTSSTDSHAIIEMITTIMAYKFTHLTREEVEAMLGIELQETGFYKSSKAEGEEIGKAKGEKIGETKVILRLLNQRFSELPNSVQQQIAKLSIAQLDALTEALLSFETPQDLSDWLNCHN